MPFKHRKVGATETNKLKRRTGEPSPVSNYYGWIYPEGYGMAEGSYTYKMREALAEWMNTNGHVLTFDYKLSRHQVISVRGWRPYIKHVPDMGGFILLLEVESINGIQSRLFINPVTFLWKRIIGREKILALPEPKSQLEIK